nr:receptor-transporting protein 1 isoform X2 [Macaca nemestrina]
MSPSWLWGPPFFLSSLFYLSSLCSCCLATALSTQRDLILDKRGKDSYALAGPEANCLGSRGHTSQEPPRPPGGALPPIAPPPGHWRPGGPLSSIPASHLLYLLEWDNFLSIPSSFGQIPSAAHACPHPEPFCSTLMVFSGSERPQNFWTNFDLQNMRERKRGFHLSSQHGLCSINQPGFVCLIRALQESKHCSNISRKQMLLCRCACVLKTKNCGKSGRRGIFINERDQSSKIQVTIPQGRKGEHLLYLDSSLLLQGPSMPSTETSG